MKIRRPVRVGLLVVLVGVLVAALAYRDWVAAQARAAVVLTVALDAPVLAWVARVVTGEPMSLETSVAGVPTTVVRPDGDGPWPAIVFVNGATERGRFHPTVRRLARGLARAGYLVYVPDLPGLAHGQITERTAGATVRVSLAAARAPDARDGRVSLVGVSVGATLALLAAEAPGLADRVPLVGGIAPYADLREMIRLATTGSYRLDGRLVPYATDPFLDLAIARSLAAGLEPSRARTLLLERLSGVDADDDDPLRVLRSLPARPLSPGARAVLAVVHNRDPGRFDFLYGRLPASVRARIRRLSPITQARRLRAQVELATSPEDDYFPPSQSEALIAIVPDARLTVTETLEHAIPDASLDDVADLFRLEAFVVRVLRGARET
jgi:pimeloyl-ACP methyl ester carboxylesterase